jgi:predicted exporter
MLAASCEVLTFGLDALTPMPAVRNFCICAATAVLLDFILQVGHTLVIKCNILLYYMLFHCQ